MIKQGPCPCGTSSDAFTTYDDGHSFCYRCNKSFRENMELENKNKTYEFLPHRGLTKDTLSYYNILVEKENDDPRVVIFPYANGASKKRRYGTWPKEQRGFFTEGDISKAGLFGKDKFDPGSKESITITAGEYDAPSIYQVTGGITAAVSTQSGTSAKRDCINDYDYINSFEKIILAFDNDEADSKAFREVASLFDPKKIYYVRFSRHKDANDYLQAEEPAYLLKAWQGAKKEIPEGIIHTFDQVSKALEKENAAKLADYPFKSLQNSLFGLHAGEFILFKGLEGIGKTEILRAMEYHALTTTPHNIGIIHLEEGYGETIRGLATYKLRAPAMMDESGISKEEVLKAYKEIVGGREDRAYIQSTFDIDDPDVVLANLRFLVTACDCRIVFLDHLSMLVTGQGEDDERKKLDYIVTRIKKSAVANKFCFVGIMHVNDDGKTRSSRYPPKIANTVVHLERDVKSLSPIEQRKTYFTVEKGRGQGTITGRVGSVYYDRDVSYTLTDIIPSEDGVTNEVLDRIKQHH